ncbi:MAG: 50S ribosomal protein L25, partial [Neisseriaceae bacterium]|nr:50S ribosomal protein L25 [Neisseriaceae bacterium]
MSEKLTAQRRETQGTGVSRRLRRDGNSPAVIYGDNPDPISITV